MLLYTTHMLRIVAIADCTQVRSICYSHLQRLVNIVHENTATDILVEDQLRPPLDMVTVYQKQELHKLNS